MATKSESNASLESLDGERSTIAPQSIYNLVFGDEEDLDKRSDDEDSYFMDENIPLPSIPDSDDTRITCCGECCECCDKCFVKMKIRNRWASGLSVTLYYIILNGAGLSIMMLILSNINNIFNQDPSKVTIAQLGFRTNMYPGLSMVPSIGATSFDNAFILLSSTNENKKYIRVIDKMFGDQRHGCRYDLQCLFDEKALGPCATPPYGYDQESPCIFLKLNKLMNWVPLEYTSRRNIPRDFPKELQQIVDVSKANIWVHCRGGGSYDNEKLGEMIYYPHPYFKAKLFPSKSTTITNPIIALKLKNIKKGRILKIVCELYAKNVHDKHAFSTFIYRNGT